MEQISRGEIAFIQMVELLKRYHGEKKFDDNVYENLINAVSYVKSHVEKV